MLTKVSKHVLLESIIHKAEDRDLKLSKNILNDEEIINCSRDEYEQLNQEIEGDLPEFEILYTTVKDYFESLPW
jgi:hypothetical protein